MKIVKIVGGLLLFASLVVLVQLADPPTDSPTVGFQRLPGVSWRTTAEAEWTGGRPETALLLLDYAIESDQPDKDEAPAMRQKILAQLAAENTPVNRLKATGWATVSAGGNSYDSLAGTTVADAALYGEVADLARTGALDGKADDFVAALNNIHGVTTVFPPAEGAITLVKAAHLTGALNDTLTGQMRQMLGLMQADPKASLAVEKFKDNFMPVFELARHCRTWGEFQTILLQANSPDQLKVLVKMVSTSAAGAEHLSQVLALASRDSHATAAASIDSIMRQGPKGLETLYAAIARGAPGLKFALDHPGLTPANMHRAAASFPLMSALQENYAALRQQYGPAAPAVKYLLIAVLCGLLVLVVVPGRYLEKLITRPGSTLPAPGAIHYLFSALAVGVVLSAMAYLLSLAVRPAAEPAAMAAALGETGAPAQTASSDSAVLSGTVVSISLLIHALVWFFVRGKIRMVEDDEKSTAELRLKRIENLDIFLDLPLFTGLALTVVAFILITLNAGMSRHFAYTSTVVGILSAVSLRVQYVYPLKERLIQPK